jgi:hypothetical protein
MSREDELARQGWKRVLTCDEPRLSEMVEMYREIGFEVHLEPFHPEEEPGCAECLQADPGRYKTIYTRKESENGPAPE